MLRLTDTEYEIISSNAKNASLPLAEYARKLITGKTPKITYEIVADLPELKKLIGEFGKIGSNLNQIARYFNSGGIHSQEMRKYIQQGIADIFEMKHEVLKMAGDLHSLSAELSSIQKGAAAHGHPETYHQ
ncbi:Bacterial mobilisation protein (MobC) [Roseburia intestinalis XB6B4]|jgi:DNA polymerase II large subunit|nr:MULTISPECIES: plasmid mobilization relaxosome protein MobC [Lachnospiraceae]CBL13841.1 Bacterial mobilisation protein (MobC) [Roseburia intestinalis XB6B4]